MLTLDEAFDALRNAAVEVPRPQRLPTPDELSQAEQELGIPFPSDFRRFQLEVSNLVCNILEPGLVLPDLLPYRSLRRIARRGWDAGVPSDALPFCNDNGNYYFIDAAGQVRYWDHDDDSESPRVLTVAEWIVEDWIGEEE